jgi:hypothetical protein
MPSAASPLACSQPDEIRLEEDQASLQEYRGCDDVDVWSVAVLYRYRACVQRERCIEQDFEPEHIFGALIDLLFASLRLAVRVRLIVNYFTYGEHGAC